MSSPAALPIPPTGRRLLDCPRCGRRVELHCPDCGACQPGTRCSLLCEAGHKACAADRALGDPGERAPYYTLLATA